MKVGKNLYMGDFNDSNYQDSFNSDTIDRVVKPTVVRERLIRGDGVTKEQMMTMRNEMVVSSDDINEELTEEVVETPTETTNTKKMMMAGAGLLGAYFLMKD